MFVGMLMCLPVCVVHVSIDVCVRVYMNVRVHIRGDMQVRVYMHGRKHLHDGVCMHMHMHMHVHMHVHVRVRCA